MNMNYEVVELSEKQVTGLSARTSNVSPEMEGVIGGLWERFYQPGVYDAVTGRVNEKSVGIYTDYEEQERGDYTAFVGCETEDGGLPEGMVRMTIPKGRYARFVLKGNMYKIVGEFWQELWNMDLNRAFVCDFEEYQNSDMENAEIHVYIGLA